MSNIDKSVIEEFCSHCDWTYQCWMMRKHLYDENPDERLLRHPHHHFFFTRLEKILQEYWLQEVAKLHDPATQYGFDNLSVDYILNSGQWPDNLKSKLQKLKDEMSKFSMSLRDVRNKLLSHKDKDTIVSGVTLGGFNAGEDVTYFKSLEEFVSEVHNYVLGTPYLFDDLVKNDIEIFMATFSKGLA